MARSTYYMLPDGTVVRAADVRPDQAITVNDPTTGEPITITAEEVAELSSRLNTTMGPQETLGGRRGRPLGIMASDAQRGGTGLASQLGMIRSTPTSVKAGNQANAAGTNAGLVRGEAIRAERAAWSDQAISGGGLGISAQGRSAGMAVGRDRQAAMSNRSAPSALMAPTRPNPAAAEMAANAVSAEQAVANNMAAINASRQAADAGRGIGTDVSGAAGGGAIGGVSADDQAAMDRAAEKGGEPSGGGDAGGGAK